MYLDNTKVYSHKGPTAGLIEELNTRFSEFELPKSFVKLCEMVGARSVEVEVFEFAHNVEGCVKNMTLTMIIINPSETIKLYIRTTAECGTSSEHAKNESQPEACFVVFSYFEKVKVKPRAEKAPQAESDDAGGFKLRMSTTAKVAMGVAAATAVGYGLYKFFKK